MTGTSKIRGTHLERMAFVYVRQSGLAQVRHHRESTARQYGLAGEASRLGWEESHIAVIQSNVRRLVDSGKLTAVFFQLIKLDPHS